MFTCDELRDRQLAIGAPLSAPVDLLINELSFPAPGISWLNRHLDRTFDDVLENNLKEIEHRLSKPRELELKKKILSHTALSAIVHAVYPKSNFCDLLDLTTLVRAFGVPTHTCVEFLRDVYSDSSTSVSLESSHGALLIDAHSDSRCLVKVRPNGVKGLHELKAAITNLDDGLTVGKFFSSSISNDRTEIIKAVDTEDFRKIAQYCFEGPLALVAIGALFERTLRESRHVGPVRAPFSYLDASSSLENLTSTFPERRVSFKSDSECRVWGDCVEFSVMKINEQRYLVDFSIVPQGLIRDGDRWFRTTDAAMEIATILTVSGVLAALPNLGKYLTEDETHINLRDGNGYASLSRSLCGIVAGRKSQELLRLKSLDHIYDGDLSTGLLKLQAAATHRATHHIVDLITGALGAGPRYPGIPVFRSGPETLSGNNCDDAEGYFTAAVTSGQYTLDSHFIHKSTGASTSLTRQQICINNCLIPAGTICAIHAGVANEILVTPIRLSMFSVPIEEGVDVFRHHYKKMGSVRGNEDSRIKEVYRLLSPG